MAFIHNCSEKLESFLNNLDENILKLLKPSALRILEEPDILDDFNSVIVYGNENMYLDTYFRVWLKNKYKLASLSLRESQFEESQYKYSDYHFEFPCSDKHVKFIKSVIKNQNISGKRFIFYLKNMEGYSKQAQLSLKTIIDKNNAVFFFGVRTMKDINTSITSRSFLINAAFPSKNMESFAGEKIERSLVATLAGLSGLSRIELALDHVILKMTKSKNELEILAMIREYCYKVYHLCIPLGFIAKHVINKYAKHKKIYAITEMAAECDHLMTIGSKDILLYENFFVKLYQILR